MSRSYVLVTGGTGGIGSSICRLLPSIGLTPIVGFKTNATHAQILAEELGGFSLRIDMSSDDSIAEATQTLISRIVETKTLIGVVLGASPPPDLAAFSSLTSNQLNNQLRVNVIGAQLLLSGLIKNFFRKSRAGTVVGILSQAIGSDNCSPATGMGAYVIAKAALNSMLVVCATEYSWLKVRSVSPGFTNTKMLEVFDPRYLEMMQSQKDFSSPEDIAQLVIQEIES